MRAIHLDEATLLRSVIGELPPRQQTALKRHVASCRPCQKERDTTKRLHDRLSGVGDSLAFSADDPFERRPAWREVKVVGRSAVKAMAAALGRLDGEKTRVRAAVEVAAIRAALDLDLDDAAARLAAAHFLEEAASGDSSKDFSAFAEALSVRTFECEPEAEEVLPGALLRALAHLVVGSWRLFAGRRGEAEAELAAAWTALGTFEAPEHLLAWVEVGESLRRSYDGRPVEARLLAERALATFERYGLGRGILRARHARAVALYTVGEYREAHREFRAALGSKDATRLDRARAVSGAAFCLAARGRFHEAAKEYSPVRRKLKGEGAMTEQYLLQGEMKVALGTAGRWHPRRDGLAAFALPECGGAFHAREIAVEIVKAVSEEGLEKAKELLGKIGADASRGYIYLYSCQLAHPKVPSNPPMYVEFARTISEVARSLCYLKAEGLAQPVYCEQVLGEAVLLESNALTHTGLCAEAIEAARRARLRFGHAGEDGFSLAFADYLEGAAAIFSGEFGAAWRLLKSARSVFQIYGQENFQGRAQAALGLLALHRGKYSSALQFYEQALQALQPDGDGTAYAATLVNRGYALVKIGRLDAARAAYARALQHARRLQMNVTFLTIRFGLLAIDLLEGNVVRALGGFERMECDARSMGFEEFILGAQLRIAECLSRLGRTDDVPKRIDEIKRSPYAVSLSNEDWVRELLESIEVPSAAQIAHIADYFEGRSRGVRATYRPLRLVGKRN